MAVLSLLLQPHVGPLRRPHTGASGNLLSLLSRFGELYWNMFDQVLLRPGLMDSLTELRILDGDGQASLLSERGRPRSATASDHLPILFRLDL